MLASRKRRAWLESALDRYQAQLMRYAAKILGDDDKARDVVQETFVKLWTKPPQDDAGELAPWLFTVCRHLACDVLRKEQRMVPLSPDAPLAADDPRAGAQQEIEAREGLASVMDALAVLPANQQEVIRLKFQNGLSYKDISRVTGLSVSHVGVLIHNGIKTMRQSLAPVAAVRAPTPAPRKGGAR
jgi:RNA polymerase sigma-70 factor (ECF subfamily)